MKSIETLQKYLYLITTVEIKQNIHYGQEYKKITATDKIPVKKEYSDKRKNKGIICQDKITPNSSV